MRYPMTSQSLDAAKVKAQTLREHAKDAGDRYMAALEKYEAAKKEYKAAGKDADKAFDAADIAEMVVTVLAKALGEKA